MSTALIAAFNALPVGERGNLMEHFGWWSPPDSKMIDALDDGQRLSLIAMLGLAAQPAPENATAGHAESPKAISVEPEAWELQAPVQGTGLPASDAPTGIAVQVAVAKTFKHASKNHTLTLPELAGKIKALPAIDDKKDGYIIHAGVFPEAARTRTMENIEGVTMLMRDHDGRNGDTMTRSELKAKCVSAGVEVIFWDTHTPDEKGTTFRAGFPLNKVLPTDLHAPAQAALDAFLGGGPLKPLPACQGFFCQPRPGHTSNVEVIHGNPVDTLIDFTKLEPDTTVPSSDGEHHVAVGSQLTDEQIADIRAVIAALRAAGAHTAEGKGLWHQFIGALAPYGEAGEVLANELSVGGFEYSPKAVAKCLRAKRRNGATGAGQFFHLAEQHFGIENPARGRSRLSASDDFADEIAGAPADDPGLDDDEEEQAEETSSDIRLPPPFPGAHASIVSAILRSSHVPQSDLARLCALIGMATCIPNPYHFKDGSRCNLFGAGLAESTEGKEAGPNAVEAICRSLNVNVLSKPASGEALEDAITTDSMLVNIREAGHVFAVLAGTNPAPQHQSLVAAMLDAFSMSARTFTPRTKANTQKRDPVPNPTISLLMMSTPDKMANALTEANISDGLLGRILLAMGNTDANFNFDAEGFVVPDEVTKFMFESDSAEEHSGGLIEWSDEAGGYFKSLVGKWFNEKRDLQRRGDKLTAALIGRRQEKFKRICGVLAVWGDQKKPTINMAMAEWTQAFVEASDRTMLAFVSRGLGSDDQVVMDGERVLLSMKKIKAGVVNGRVASQNRLIEMGHIPRSLVQDNCRMGPKRFANAVEHLEATGYAVEQDVSYTVKDKTRESKALVLIKRRAF